MKDTYDNTNLKFLIEFTKKNGQKEEVPFDTVYGMESLDVVRQISGDSLHNFTLRGQRSFKVSANDIYSISQQSEFLHMEAKKGSCFEEVIGEYFKSSLSSLKNIEKIHALNFLERYCMKYEEIKKLVKE